MLDYRRFKEINDLFAAGQTVKARRLLMEQQSKSIALQDENDMLHVRLKTYEDILQVARNLCNERGFYWLKTDGVKQGPFCPRCYELEGGLIRLERRRKDLICPCCGAVYALPAPPEVARPEGHRAKIIPFRQVAAARA
ncbi:MAG: hypothetical protein LBR22_07560 [Desulfovibrio sp.]|jgi:hypothetical protein|nr:hypothetical protein [Desulfovibrio sp.]